jgi:hypothetical protein
MVYNTQNYCFFFNLSNVRYCKELEVTMLWNWICVHPHVRGEAPSLLGHIEKASFKLFLRDPRE